jgi:hypothetical protein
MGGWEGEGNVHSAFIYLRVSIRLVPNEMPAAYGTTCDAWTDRSWVQRWCSWSGSGPLRCERSRPSFRPGWNVRLSFDDAKEAIEIQGGIGPGEARILEEWSKRVSR